VPGLTPLTITIDLMFSLHDDDFNAAFAGAGSRLVCGDVGQIRLLAFTIGSEPGAWSDTCRDSWKGRFSLPVQPI
ncbi:hypothetical protein, partial [Winslowiella iniecta]